MPEPMRLPAPARLSTTTCCRTASLIARATTRPMLSMPVAGELGTTMRMGLTGKPACATAWPALNRPMAMTEARMAARAL